MSRELLNYIKNSPSPFHAVYQAKLKLEAAGFKEIKERLTWDSLKKGEKYFFTRNQSALVAFAIGGKFEAGNGFSIVGAHTDSPCLKVKPKSRKEKLGYVQVGVECYGGGLW